VTLRARLTAAFLAVVLGPVLVGAAFVGGTVTAVNHSRSGTRLTVATGAVRTSVDALCQRLRTAVRTAAVQGAEAVHQANVSGASSAANDAKDVAQSVVRQGLADGAVLNRANGQPLATAGTVPAGPWADCDQPAASAPQRLTAISARVTMVDSLDEQVGSAVAVLVLNSAMLSQLGAASGASITLAQAGGTPLSTERPDRAAKILTSALRLHGGVGEADGRYVRRLDPAVSQPLPLAVSVATAHNTTLYVVLVLLVLLTGLVAVVAAARLAQSTARPLAELSRAADRVAAGDLSARVPVGARDEVGRLAETFNRMTREMQSYVEALTASRDQLRSNLGLLGDTLSSTHDQERMLRVILHTAISATGATAGVVLLVDESTRMLVGQVGEGVPEQLPRLPIAERGLLGRVAATGEPRRGRINRDGPDLVRGEPPCRTYMAVPFAAPASASTPEDTEPPVRGVLALYNRLGTDEFDDTDLVRLSTFAGQAAVAVDNVRHHEQARRLSHTDPLTGLANYRTLGDTLRRELERASRFGHRLCVLALDLDRFKRVNDSYGHAAGDAVLAEFARRVRSEIREVDLAFRQGGEEFVILLPETDADGGAALAQRLGEAVRNPPMQITARRLRTGNGPVRALRIPVSVSIGIAVFPDHGVTPAAVLGAADDALYAAKAAGRDAYRIAQPPAGGTPARRPAAPRTRTPSPSLPAPTSPDAAPEAAPPAPVASPADAPQPAGAGVQPPLPEEPAAEPPVKTSNARPARSPRARSTSTNGRTNARPATRASEEGEGGPARPLQDDPAGTAQAGADGSPAADTPAEEGEEALLVAPGGASNSPPAPRQPRGR
jgi:two-component system, cell cycle response regulator